jgi:LmbE family N-acetylglucosaminyl deacetylase
MHLEPVTGRGERAPRTDEAHRGQNWSDELDPVAHDRGLSAAGSRPPRVLAVFAHPDDETLCAGGTLAKYASAGADVRVVSLTMGGSGQIRDAGAATRATLTATRERELRAAGKELGLAETRCLDFPDGQLAGVDREELVTLASGVLDELDPDVVITFGPDGFTGHPDHVAVGAAVTAACHERSTSSPAASTLRLFHCHRPQSRLLLRDRLAGWVVEMTTRFKGTKDFVHAMSVFSRETTALGYAADFVNVEWFPAGTYLIEQGETASTMYLILSGHVEIRREGEDGDVRLVDVSRAGEFVGEQGIATGLPRNAHVVAADDVTTLTFSTPDEIAIDASRATGQRAQLRTLPSGDRIDATLDTCIDVSEFVGHKIRATAAHRSQYPIDPALFPRDVLQQMFGVEYFTQVVPERELRSSLFDDAQSSAAMS